MSADSHSMQALSREYFKSAKRWWAASNIARTAAYVFGATMAFFEVWVTGYPFLVAGLFGLASGFRWKSNQEKQSSELLRRKLDFEESFGIRMSKIEVADLKAQLGASDLPTPSSEAYFASGKSSPDSSGEKAFENLRESAWWSKHIARSAQKLCNVLAVALVGLSILALIVSIKFLADLETISGVSKVVTSTLYFVFSARLFRSALAYRDFATRAEGISKSSDGTLERGEVDKLSAMQMWHEYHLARAAAPLLPEWLYKWRRDSLNKTWKAHFG